MALLMMKWRSACESGCSDINKIIIHAAISLNHRDFELFGLETEVDVWGVLT